MNLKMQNTDRNLAIISVSILLTLLLLLTFGVTLVKVQ